MVSFLIFPSKVEGLIFISSICLGFKGEAVGDIWLVMGL